MNTTMMATAVASLAALMSAAGSTAVDRLVGDPVPPESRVWITGTSNVSRFSCRAEGVSGIVDLRANPTRRSVLSGENVSNAASLRIPVVQLDCGVSAMNRQLREALRSTTYEAIEFHLDSYDVQSAGIGLTARIAGRLRITGTERPVVLAAAVDADTLGRVHIRGRHEVRMTDFGVQPPRRFAGLVWVHDQIVVHFDIVPARGVGAVDIVQHTSPVNAGGSHAAESDP